MVGIKILERFAPNIDSCQIVWELVAVLGPIQNFVEGLGFGIGRYQSTRQYFPNQLPLRRSNACSTSVLSGASWVFWT